MLSWNTFLRAFVGYLLSWGIVFRGALALVGYLLLSDCERSGEQRRTKWLLEPKVRRALQRGRSRVIDDQHLICIRLSDSKYRHNRNIPTETWTNPHSNRSLNVTSFGTTKDSFIPRDYAQHATSNSVSTLRECVRIGQRTKSVISCKTGVIGWLGWCSVPLRDTVTLKCGNQSHKNNEELLLFAGLCVGKERE